MTEPTDRDRELAATAHWEAHLRAAELDQIPRPWRRQLGFMREECLKAISSARSEGAASRPNLPPLFEADDWLWVIQSLGYVRFEGDGGDFEARHRMDRIIAKLLDYRAEDVRREKA